MRIKKWKRAKGLFKGKKIVPVKRHKKRVQLLISRDDLRSAEQPPDWMRELLFDSSDDDKIAG